MSKGSRPECFGRLACETPARSPFGLRPAPRRLPPQFMNPNSLWVDLVFFMKSQDQRSRDRFAKNTDLLARTQIGGQFGARTRAAQLDGVAHRGRHSGATCALEVATEDATRPSCPATRLVRACGVFRCDLQCTARHRPSLSLPRASGPPSSCAPARYPLRPTTSLRPA